MMIEQLPDLNIHVEVMGCPTTCQHCWAVGHPYQAMALDEISCVLHEIRRFCDAHHLTVGGYPMHEVAAHPQAGQVMKLFHHLWGLVEEPVAATGVPLSTRDDWHEFLETLCALGTSTLWFAFHAANEVHDQSVLRKGAYQESLRAVERAREAGMKVRCNLFLTKGNVRQFDQIIADLQRVGIQQIIPEIYNFLPNARGRHSEPLRPEWQDVKSLIGQLDCIPETAFWGRFWYELPDKYTESWYIHQAMEGTWPDEQTFRLVSLVCRPNLDIYGGIAGQYTKYYGNLRKDGTDPVLRRAVANGACSDDEIWFAEKPLPPIQELAIRFGRPDSERIHTNGTSIRRLWLDYANKATSRH